MLDHDELLDPSRAQMQREVYMPHAASSEAREHLILSKSGSVFGHCPGALISVAQRENARSTSVKRSRSHATVCAARAMYAYAFTCVSNRCNGTRPARDLNYENCSDRVFTSSRARGRYRPFSF